MKSARAIVLAFLARAVSANAQQASTAATALPSPTLSTQSVSTEGAWLSAYFEGGKDGKKLTAKGTIPLRGRTFGGRVRAEVSLSGAETDDQTGQSRVIHAFDRTPGGTLAAGFTWDTFDLETQRAALDKIAELCAPLIAKHEDCAGKEDLPQADRAKVDAAIHDSPSLILYARGEVSAQYTKFFDPATNAKGDDLAWPGGVTVGAGILLSPTLLVGVTGAWKLLRNVPPATQLCKNLPIEGSTATPPVLVCSNTVVGAPSWKHEVLGKFELRQYLLGGLGWNPSVSFAGPVSHGTVAFSQAWRVDVPLYFTLSRIKDKTLTAGVGFSHWHDDEGTYTDVSVFLAAGFSLLDSVKR